jgi:hypothetical protein
VPEQPEKLSDWRNIRRRNVDSKKIEIEITD